MKSIAGNGGPSPVLTRLLKPVIRPACGAPAFTVPRWVAEGAKVRVKTSPALVKYGLATCDGYGGKTDATAWPDELGELRNIAGDWIICFSRGRMVRPDATTIRCVERVSK